MDDKQRPYPDDPGRTHYDGCWRERGHHNCAVAEIDRLRAALDLALNALRSYQYGNGSPDLAKEVADKLRTILKGGV